MRLIGAAALAVMFSSGQALANDFPQCFDKAILAFVDCEVYDDFFGYDWNGYYVGAHAGYGELDLSGSYKVNAANGVQADDVEANGFVGGGQAGVTFQQGFYVFGLEVDASYAEMEAKTSRSAGGATNSIAAEVNGFGSVRARVGVAIDEILPYVTAGAGAVSYKLTVEDTALNLKAEEEDTAFVGVIGGGVEVGLTPEISLRGEGLYYYIDEDVEITGPNATSDTIKIEDLWTLRGGMNWRF